MSFERDARCHGALKMSCSVTSSKFLLRYMSAVTFRGPKTRLAGSRISSVMSLMDLEP